MLNGKFLIVEPSPLPILILLGPKYASKYPVSNTLSLRSSLNVRDNHIAELQCYCLYILMEGYSAISMLSPQSLLAF